MVVRPWCSVVFEEQRSYIRFYGFLAKELLYTLFMRGLFCFLLSKDHFHIS